MGTSRLARSPGIGCRVRAEGLLVKAQLRDQNKSALDLLHEAESVPKTFLLNQFAVSETKKAVISDRHKLA